MAMEIHHPGHPGFGRAGTAACFAVARRLRNKQVSPLIARETCG
jgi:hypothetical protein